MVLRIAPPAISLWLALLGPTSGPAEAAFICPGGPGQGDVMVGLGNSSGASVCDVAADAHVDPGPSGYCAERFAAIAWGRGGAGSPAYRSSAGFAKCSLGPWVANDPLAVAVSDDGRQHAETGATGKPAERKALRLCS
jgi:hypothetical protein